MCAYPFNQLYIREEKYRRIFTTGSATARVEFSAPLLPHPHPLPPKSPQGPKEDTQLSCCFHPLPHPGPSKERTPSPNTVGAQETVGESAALTKAAAADAPSCRQAWTPGHSLGLRGRGDPGPALPSGASQSTSLSTCPHAGFAPRE